MDAAKKLQLFSKKLNRPIELSFSGDGIMFSDWTDGGWSNSGGRWLDHGWNNQDWMDHGWNNQSWMDEGWNNQSWSDSGWSNSGDGCFITTVCVEHMGLPDNCHELETLRYFRDKLVKEDNVFREKVLDYYRKAPVVVQQIMKNKYKDDILEKLYHDLVQECVILLESQKIEEAKNYYLKVYEDLVTYFLSNISKDSNEYTQ